MVFPDSASIPGICYVIPLFCFIEDESILRGQETYKFSVVWLETQAQNSAFVVVQKGPPRKNTNKAMF
jgi:hypothetical protein